MSLGSGESWTQGLWDGGMQERGKFDDGSVGRGGGGAESMLCVPRGKSGVGGCILNTYLNT